MWRFIKENHKTIQMMLAGIVALLWHYHFFLSFPMAIVVFIVLMVYPCIFPHGYDDYVLNHGHNLKQIERSYLRRRRQYPWLDLHLAFACCADNEIAIGWLNKLGHQFSNDINYPFWRAVLMNDAHLAQQVLDKYPIADFSPHLYLFYLITFLHDDDAVVWAKFHQLQHELAFKLYTRDCQIERTSWCANTYDALAENRLVYSGLKGFSRYVAFRSHQFWRKQLSKTAIG